MNFDNMAAPGNVLTNDYWTAFPGQQIIWALPAQNVVTSFHSYNATNDTGTCRFSFAQRFLQYDIDQAYNYIVNNAIPTR